MKSCWRYLLRREIRNRPPVHPRAWVFLLVALLPPLLLSAASAAFAGSATWNLNPTSGDWGTASNWTPATVPNGPNDTATFGVSNITELQTTSEEYFNIEVNGIVFDAGASAFTIFVQDFGSFNHSLTISGVGITNESGITQNFVADTDDDLVSIEFTNSATAGNLTVFNIGHDATLTFLDSSTAGNSTLIATNTSSVGPTISFSNDSTGGTARVEVSEDCFLDISTHNAPGLTVGSLGGNGTVMLGGNNLTVGSNDYDTVFSGVIRDNGAGGSLTKVGSGTLLLAQAHAYSGGTTVSGGNLFVQNQRGSATGSGIVQVNAGRLGGRGIIAGPVTVGTASESGSLAELSPADNGVVGTLNLLSTLTFNAHGIYDFGLNSHDVVADRVIANGVTIRPGAHFFVTALGDDFWSSAELYDSATGTWTTTGSLNTARYWHTATLLPDGMVLVAGGVGVPLVSAELYNPGTETWTTTGSLNTGRYQHTATLLPSGKVLVAGGVGSVGDLSSAELYDPTTGNWTGTGDLSTARSLHTATLLPSGKVLIAGGIGIGGELASAELYDPATGIWSTTGSLAQAREFHTATLLPSGKVLVAGGRDNFVQLASADLYNPATGTWSAARSLATARDSHTATLLPSGEVLVAGGFGGNASAELYDPATGTWSATGSLITARGGHTATLLPNGEVLAAAGFSVNYPYPPLSSAELYDPAAGTWASATSLADVRSGHTATLLSNGDVLVAGGLGAGILPIGTAFTAIDNTSAAPISGTFANLADGSIINVGGIYGNNYQVSYEGGDGNDLTLTVVP